MDLKFVVTLRESVQERRNRYTVIDRMHFFLLCQEIMSGGRGRPRQKLMDWMMEDGYGKRKEKAQHREELSRCAFGPAMT